MMIISGGLMVVTEVDRGRVNAAPRLRRSGLNSILDVALPRLW